MGKLFIENLAGERTIGNKLKASISNKKITFDILSNDEVEIVDIKRKISDFLYSIAYNPPDAGNLTRVNWGNIEGFIQDQRDLWEELQKIKAGSLFKTTVNISPIPGDLNTIPLNTLSPGTPKPKQGDRILDPAGNEARVTDVDTNFVYATSDPIQGQQNIYLTNAELPPLSGTGNIAISSVTPGIPEAGDFLISYISEDVSKSGFVAKILSVTSPTLYVQTTARILSGGGGSLPPFTAGYILTASGTENTYGTPINPSTFQAALVSGTNIKTINSTTLLGTGDIATLQIGTTAGTAMAGNTAVVTSSNLKTVQGTSLVGTGNIVIIDDSAPASETTTFTAKTITSMVGGSISGGVIEVYNYGNTTGTPNFPKTASVPNGADAIDFVSNHWYSYIKATTTWEDKGAFNPAYGYRAQVIYFMNGTDITGLNLAGRKGWGVLEEDSGWVYVGDSDTILTLDEDTLGYRASDGKAEIRKQTFATITENTDKFVANTGTTFKDFWQAVLNKINGILTALTTLNTNITNKQDKLTYATGAGTTVSGLTITQVKQQGTSMTACLSGTTTAGIAANAQINKITGVSLPPTGTVLIIGVANTGSIIKLDSSGNVTVDSAIENGRAIGAMLLWTV